MGALLENIIEPSGTIDVPQEFKPANVIFRLPELIILGTIV